MEGFQLNFIIIRDSIHNCVCAGDPVSESSLASEADWHAPESSVKFEFERKFSK